MTVSYSDIAARGLERISALSDAVFAITMTLIVLEIHIPDSGPIHTEQDLLRAKRRILIAQALYAFGAALCLISRYWSIAFILLVQLNFAIGPRIRALSRLRCPALACAPGQPGR